jgi:secretion/DNA translocation related CpaE-like protein
MVRTSRSISRTAAQLAAGKESPDRAGGPATPAAPESPESAPVSSRAHPLFVTADPDLLDDLLRLAADAGVTPDVAPDPAGARRSYPHAVRVYVGADMAEPCARAGLPHRPGIVVVIREGASGPNHPGVGARSAGGGPPDADWAVVQRLGAEHVVVLPAAEPWLVDQLAAIGGTDGTDGTRSTLSGVPAGGTGAHDSVGPTTSRAIDGSLGGPGHGRVIAVLGGRGGAGASVLAGGLAVTAARRGLRTLLVDADPLGGGVDLVLGWESLDGLRWPALSQASGEVPAPALVEALPGRSELVILSWDRGEPMTVPPEAMLAALDAGRRGRDLTIVDLPRRLDESAMLALRAADQVYLVVPAELRACAAAARVAAVAGPHCAALSVVVRQPGPAGLAVKEVIAALQLPYAGTILSEPRLRTAWERGEPPAASGHGSLATLCGSLLDAAVPTALSYRNTSHRAGPDRSSSDRAVAGGTSRVGARSTNGLADSRAASREESA